MKQDSGNESTERLGVPSAETKPTPELKAWEWNTQIDEGTIACHSLIANAGDGWVLCRWWGERPQPSAARLIAAAPALYAALKVLTDECTPQGRDLAGKSMTVTRMPQRSVVDDARAALALADGQETNTAKSYREGIEASIAVVTNYHTYGFPRTPEEIHVEIAAELQALLTKT